MTEETSNNIKEKNKTSALWLTLFFGFWGWLYTYRMDKIKFWISFVLFITGLIMISNIAGLVFLILVGLMGLFAFIETCTRPKKFYEDWRMDVKKDIKENKEDKKYDVLSVVLVIIIVFLTIFIFSNLDSNNNYSSSTNQSNENIKSLSSEESSSKQEVSLNVSEGNVVENQISSQTEVESLPIETTAQVKVGQTEAEPLPVSTETAAQKNAVSKAKSYLNYSAFSREGLIEQLEYEQFSHVDAVYAVDNSGANWNEQAVKKGKSYLDNSAFSYNGFF